uniref:Uncharacterized protein n=1 Tax=Steinernema glaseri TaxID=37863 RepID=A0A1I7XXE3_9BILA
MPRFVRMEELQKRARKSSMAVTNRSERKEYSGGRGGITKSHFFAESMTELPRGRIRRCTRELLGGDV